MGIRLPGVILNHLRLFDCIAGIDGFKACKEVIKFLANFVQFRGFGSSKGYISCRYEINAAVGGKDGVGGQQIEHPGAATAGRDLRVADSRAFPGKVDDPPFAAPRGLHSLFLLDAAKDLENIVNVGFAGKVEGNYAIGLAKIIGEKNLAGNELGTFFSLIACSISNAFVYEERKTDAEVFFGTGIDTVFDCSLNVLLDACQAHGTQGEDRSHD